MITGSTRGQEMENFKCCCGDIECLPVSLSEEATVLKCMVTGSIISKRSCLAINTKGKEFFPVICVTCCDSIKGGAKFKDYNDHIFFTPNSTAKFPTHNKPEWILVTGLACKLTVKLVENGLLGEDHKDPKIDDIMNLPEFSQGNNINMRE